MKKILVFLTVIFFITSTFAERIYCSLTVYNDNLALVKNVDVISLKDLTNNVVTFSDISDGIDPTSVSLKFINCDKIKVLEQNYEYDIVNITKMLYKSIDKEIKVFTKDQRIYCGNLLTFDGSQLLIKSNSLNKLFMINRNTIEKIEFPFSKDIMTKPTLTFKIFNRDFCKSRKVELAYLTTGLSWKADYVATLNDTDTKLSLNSWITLTNNTSSSYKNAIIRFMAGDINRASENTYPSRRYKAKMLLAESMDKSFSEEKIFEYHMYRINRKVTVNPKETKQLEFIQASNVKCEKKYIFEPYYDNDSIKVKIEFKNDKENNLGIAFPKGKFRIYKRDGEKNLQLLGEDNIKHTPKGEVISLTVGKAFDIKGKRVLKSRKNIDKYTVLENYEITLKNHKDKPVKITVKERFYGNFEISKLKGAVMKKIDASRVEFYVDVDKNSNKKITYSVLYKYY